MISFRLPFVNMPAEFLTLLKSNLVVSDSPAPVFDIIRPNPALYAILSRSFSEFNDGRGLEKVMLALGWPNFRDRMGSVYIHKAIYGDFPERTNMAQVEDIRNLEHRFVSHSVPTYSRLFLLGFYFALANVGIKEQTYTKGRLQVPAYIDQIIRTSQGRSEKIDWLILSSMHFADHFGPDKLLEFLNQRIGFENIYDRMDVESKVLMTQNLLAYSASVRDPDIFLYGKI